MSSNSSTVTLLYLLNCSLLTCSYSSTPVVSPNDNASGSANAHGGEYAIEVGNLYSQSTAVTGRGRPIIDTSLGFRRVLTDQNTLLRGVAISFDGGDPYNANNIKPLPSEASFIQLKTDYSINSVHCYLEGNSSQNPNAVGINVEIADVLVETTRRLDLYLVITIGCNGTNGQIHSLQKALDFWTLYADRYKNETHVIFEAHNEPAFGTLYQWTQEDWDKQVVLYNHIRALAPDSLILLGSFMSFFEHWSGGATWGADYLKDKGITWENTAFAFHGYWDNNEVFDTVDYFQASNDYPALICTEFNPYATEQGSGFNNLCESRSIGWLQFEWFGNDNDLLGFKGRIDKAGTVWNSDFNKGNWPTRQTPSIPAGKFGLYCRENMMFVRNTGSSLKADRSSYIGAYGESFEVVDAGEGLIALKTDSGHYISSADKNVSVTATATQISNTEKWEWMELPTGDIALRAHGSNTLLLSTSGSDLKVNTYGAMVNGAATFAVIREPRGKPDPIAAYYGSPQVIPSKAIIYASDYDHGAQGAALYDNDGDAEGDIYRRDRGADLQIYADGTPYIGWFDSGEWLSYTITVAESNEYSLMFRVASGWNGSFHVEFNGVNKTGTIQVSDTGGWEHFTMLRKHNVYLSEGEQKMKIVSNGGFNLMSIQAEIPGQDPPQLEIERIHQSEIQLQWPSAPALYTLEDRDSLNDSSGWSHSSTQPTDLSGYEKSVRIGMNAGSGSKFFRLSTAN